MSERGFMGHLLHVKTPFKAHRNLQSLGLGLLVRARERVRVSVGIGLVG